MRNTHHILDILHLLYMLHILYLFKYWRILILCIYFSISFVYTCDFCFYIAAGVYKSYNSKFRCTLTIKPLMPYPFRLVKTSVNCYYLIIGYKQHLSSSSIDLTIYIFLNNWLYCLTYRMSNNFGNAIIFFSWSKGECIFKLPFFLSNSQKHKNAELTIIDN